MTDAGLLADSVLPQPRSAPVSGPLAATKPGETDGGVAEVTVEAASIVDFESLLPPALPRMADLLSVPGNSAVPGDGDDAKNPDEVDEPAADEGASALDFAAVPDQPMVLLPQFGTFWFPTDVLETVTVPLAAVESVAEEPVPVLPPVAMAAAIPPEVELGAKAQRSATPPLPVSLLPMPTASGAPEADEPVILPAAKPAPKVVEAARLDAITRLMPTEPGAERQGGEALPQQSTAFTPVSPRVIAAPPLAELPQPVPVATLGAKVAQVLRQAVVTEEGVTRVTLRPAGLGLIEMELTRDAKEQTHLAIRVQNPMVLAALRHDRAALDGILAAHVSAGQLVDLSATIQPQPEGRAGGQSPGQNLGQNPGQNFADPQGGGAGQQSRQDRNPAQTASPAERSPDSPAPEAAPRDIVSIDVLI